MTFTPINKYIQIKPIEVQQNVAGFVLDGKTIARKQDEQAHIVKCISVAMDSSLNGGLLKKPYPLLIVDKQMIEEFVYDGEKLYIIKEQHIKGIIE